MAAIPRASGVALLALGCVVLVGWMIASPRLVQLYTTLGPMQVNTALGMLCCGLALLLQGIRRPRIAAVAALVPLLLAGGTLMEYALDRDLGLGRWLIEPFTQARTLNAGQMSPNTSVAFLLASFGLLTLRLSPPRPLLPTTCGAVALSLGLGALFGYVADIEWAYGWTRHGQMAVHTAGGFILAGSGIIALAGSRRSTRSHTPGAWAVATALTLCLTFTAIIWQGLGASERETVRRVVSARAESMALSLADDVHEHRRALLRLARRWEDVPDLSREAKLADVVRYLDDHAAFLALEILDSAGRVAWAAPSPRLQTLAPHWRPLPLNQEALKLARASLAPAFSPVVDLTGDLSVFQIHSPYRSDGRFAGAIVATLSVRTLLLPLSNRADSTGYRLAIYDGEREVWRRNGGEPDIERDWAQEVPLSLSGADWTLRVWPSAPHLGRLRSALPEVVLVFGVILSILVSLLALFAVRAQRNAVARRRINERLQAEVMERAAAQRNLKRSNLALTAVNGELASFAYAVSHDLRQPLRAVVGFSRILIEDCAPKLDDADREYLDRIRAAAERMGTMIDGLLRLSRVTRAELRAGDVDLSALARETARSLQAEEEHRQVDWNIAPDLHAAGDEQLLAVLVDNLLGNAWKFTANAERARIELGQAGDNGNPHYYVRDNGAGFDMQYADKLFQAFQRLHRNEEFPGTGIGLATAQRIVHRHGGRIWAESQQDAGATFYFTLHTADEDHARADTHSAG